MKNFIYFSTLLLFTWSLLSCKNDTRTNSNTNRQYNRNNYNNNNRNYNNNNRNNNNNYTNTSSRNTQSRDLFSVQCPCHTNATAIPVYGQGFTRENAIEDARNDCRNINSDFTILPNTCTVQIYFINN